MPSSINLGAGLDHTGWSWSVGKSEVHGGYFAQVWRTLPNPISVNGIWKFRECMLEVAVTVHATKQKILKRLKDHLNA